jgi:transcription-repair coupling factor (superfamily II helicase)
VRAAVNGQEMTGTTISVALSAPGTARNLGQAPLTATTSITGIPAQPLPAGRDGMRIGRRFFDMAGYQVDLESLVTRNCEADLHLPALIPEDYLPDVHARLVLYKRLANCQDLEHLNQLFEQLVDRFGRLPEPAQTLVESHRLRIAAVAVGVAKIDAGPELVTIQFRKDAPIDAAKVIKLIQKDRNVQLAGQDKLRISVKTNTPAERAQAAKLALQAIRAT